MKVNPETGNAENVGLEGKVPLDIVDNDFAEASDQMPLNREISLPSGGRFT